MSYLDPQAVEVAKAHALAEFPRESVGFVIGDRYVPTTNIHEDPENFFRVDARAYLDALATGELKALIHSHPNGPLYPNEEDMQGQIAGDVVWGIIATDGERVSQPYLWGDDLPIPELLGRDFFHGITDCYSAFRDVFRLGAEGLDKVVLDDGSPLPHSWPYPSITLPEVARNDAWWDQAENPNFYETLYKQFGFVEIPRSEARPGDGFFCAIGSETLNHAGVLLDNDVIFHQLPQRLSRREPAGLWGRAAKKWIRYVGPEASIKVD